MQSQQVVPPENATHLPSQPPNPPKNIASILPLYDSNYRIPQQVVSSENATHLPSQPFNPPKNIVSILPLYDPNYRIPHQLFSSHKFNLSTIAPIKSIVFKVTLSFIFAIKSLTFHNSDLSSLFIPKKNAFNDTNIAIMKTGIKYLTHITITLIALKATVTLSSTSLLIYRFVSPSLSTYESYKKSYLTVVDLYMRYVSLSKLQTRNKVIRRITIVLPIMFMQDLYEKFYDKEKLVIFTSNKPFKQHATRQNLGYAVFERFGSIRSLSESTPKAIAQGLIVQ